MPHPTSQGCKLVISNDPKKADAVQKMFRETLDGRTMREIAIDLNDSGLRTRHGNRFTISAICKMLRNPVYCGAHVVGRYMNGEFSKVFDELTVINEEAHDPIVDRQTFDAVQSILKARSGGRFYGNKQNYLLSGIVVCGHCGQKIYGKTGTVITRKTGTKSRKPQMYYQCQNMAKASERDAKNCISITGDKLEEAVIQIIKTEVLTDANLSHCEAAYHASLAEENSPQSNRIADELRQQIERAEKNLALAEDSANFTAIARQLRAWRRELSQIVETEATPKVRSPFQGLGIEHLRSCREFLDTVDRGRLSDAIRQSIDSIVISHAEVGTRRKTARVLFYPEVFSGGEILIPWESLHVYNGGRKRLPGFIATLGRPATEQDVMDEFGLAQATVEWYLQ